MGPQYIGICICQKNCKMHIFVFVFAKEMLEIISFSILGLYWYEKPYYFGNAGYAFPYLLEATNLTKPVFLSIPKPWRAGSG